MRSTRVDPLTVAPIAAPTFTNQGRIGVPSALSHAPPGPFTNGMPSSLATRCGHSDGDDWLGMTYQTVDPPLVDAQVRH
ncbi:MAG: hypothetical protein O2815_12435 [Actinomycetota bacterium]|nr:hypothetical protein [Actinomycetota bacterium]